MRGASGTDRGASLVEFALVLPVLVMLLLGLITGGLALNEKQQMTYAVSDGARYAATVPHDQAFDDGLSWASNVRALIVERSSGSLSAADICVSLVWGSPGVVVGASGNYSTAGGGTPCISGQTFPTAANSTRVQVTASKPDQIQLGVFGTINVTLKSQATAKATTEYVAPSP